MNITMMKSFDAVAMAGVDFEISYALVYAKIKKVKAALSEHGINGKIAIFADNSPMWAFALYGAWLNNSTVIPIDARSSVDEVAFILSDATPYSLCVSRENIDVAKAALEKCEQKPQLIVLEELLDGTEEPDSEKNWKIECEESDLALIVYTSGTTGNPKGVMLTFANLYANMKAVYDAKYFFDGIRVLTMLPFHHILPLMGTLIMPLSLGGRLSFPRTISPVDIAEVLQKYPVDMVVSVPRFYELLHTNIMVKIKQSKIASALFSLAKFVNNEKFSTKVFSAVHKKFGGQVKFWISGGAALDKKIWRDLETLGFGIREGYGMTECAPIITFPRIGRVRVGSPGEPLNGIEIRIVDGEIVVRGGNVTQGYYNRPEETAESIKNGWLYTGDLGYVDEDGFLYITGRRKEIIVLPNGKNINPADLEIQLKRQNEAEILEVGVMMLDNMLQAVIRVSTDLVDRLGVEEAEKYVRDNFVIPYNRSTVTYKRIIKFVLTTEELPRTRVGKLKRHQLPAYVESVSGTKIGNSEPEPNTETYAELKTILAGQISMPVRVDAHMEMDLGLDSLGKIAMQSYIKENYGVDVTERDFEKYSTLRMFANFIDENRDNSFENQTKNVTWSDIIKSQPYPELPKLNPLHFLSIFLFKTFGKLFYKVEYRGEINIDTDKPVIIAPNHQCYLDGLFTIIPFSNKILNKTYFFAKLRTILSGGFIRSYANSSNVIVMDINDNVSEAIRKLAEVLREGGRIVIFPEGTRTKDGTMGDFKQTFAILAKEMNVQVIPVAISGAFEAVKENATIPNFGSKIVLEYLPAISPKDDESYSDFALRVKNEVEKVVLENSKKM